MRKSLIVCAVIFLGVFVFAQTAPAVESTFHGQFRMNSYYLDSSDENDFGDEDTNQATRARYRPTWDVAFDNGVKLHLQFNIGHINSNPELNVRCHHGTSNACGEDDVPVFALRHAYVSTPVPFAEGWSLVGGLVPWDDKFDQTLFSSDWDFNPLAYALVGNPGGLNVRIAHANVSEGSENIGDDIFAWIVDADHESGLGVSWYYFEDGSGSGIASPLGAGDVVQHYLGVRYARSFNDVGFNAFIVYNVGEIEQLGSPAGPDIDNDGVAAKAQLKFPLGAMKVSVMGVWASGDGEDFGSKDSDAFITPMSIYGGHGYWGYVGKLTVQGPTDTGIDDPVRIDGGSYSNAKLGTGIISVQVNASFNIIPDELDGYIGAGFFASDDEASGGDDDVGFDVIAMGTYHFGSGLNLDFGIDYAALGDGHHSTEGTGPGGTNQDRDQILVFSRFQLEY
jgi:hypothetical protein